MVRYVRYGTGAVPPTIRAAVHNLAWHASAPPTNLGAHAPVPRMLVSVGLVGYGCGDGARGAMLRASWAQASLSATSCHAGGRAVSHVRVQGLGQGTATYVVAALCERAVGAYHRGSAQRIEAPGLAATSASAPPLLLLLPSPPCAQGEGIGIGASSVSLPVTVIPSSSRVGTRVVAQQAALPAPPARARLPLVACCPGEDQDVEAAAAAGRGLTRPLSLSAPATGGFGDSTSSSGEGDLPQIGVAMLLLLLPRMQAPWPAARADGDEEAVPSHRTLLAFRKGAPARGCGAMEISVRPLGLPAHGGGVVGDAIRLLPMPMMAGCAACCCGHESGHVAGGCGPARLACLLRADAWPIGAKPRDGGA